MYEQEKQRATHLMILFCNTILIFILIGEALFFQWDTGAIVLLIMGIVANWVFHITGKIPESNRIWLYFILTMLAFFFYGIHESSIYDLAPVMMVVIMMYSATGRYSIIRLCVLTYFFTMCYDFMFVLSDSMKLTPLSIKRILLHFVLVYMAGRIVKSVMQRRRAERKNANNRIAELEETNRRIESFLTNVSHELRTPINAVTGITAIMLKNEENAGKKKDILSVQSAGHRLFNQIEDILDYTEIDTGKITVSEDNYMISSLINDIVIGNGLMERENALELIFDIDASIPSVLVGDGRKIKKILKHLIDNAIKFTKKGGVYVRVYAIHKAYGINLCIKVSDTGIGIAEKNIEKIKERFFQSSGGRNRRAGGLGLGLAIVYGMVSEMEGFIQIESEEGNGTTVSVSIPQKVADASPAMTVENRSDLCMACFLRLEKFKVPEVRKYYDEMISHLVHGLDISLHRVFDMEELKRLIGIYQLTHLFIGREEYEESRFYFEGLDKKIKVIVVADKDFVLPQASRVKLLRKPFCCLSIINSLTVGGTENTDMFEGKHMICPGIKVLVVDDEPMNLMVAEGIFKEYQMKVKTAQSGVEAISICGKEDFDLIFLDHMMPEMDGVETLKRLRKFHTDTGKELTVIAFTANAVSGAREMFLREGFSEFVSKPIEDLELERVLKKVLPKSAIEYVDEIDMAGNEVEYIGEQSCEKAESIDGQIPKINSEEDKIIRLKNIGLNIQSGIQYSRGDMEFYEELLTRFAQDAERKSVEMVDFYEKEDFANYRILVHALKSAAKMVGADDLSEMARKVEEAAKNSDVAYIKGHHEELLEKYHEMEHGILDVFDFGETVSVQEDSGDCTEISTDELVRRLAELKESLDTYEADKAEALMSEMSGAVYQGKPVNELLHDVRQDVDDFELSAASGKVEALINGMEGGEA